MLHMTNPVSTPGIRYGLPSEEISELRVRNKPWEELGVVPKPKETATLQKIQINVRKRVCDFWRKNGIGKILEEIFAKSPKEIEDSAIGVSW